VNLRIKLSLASLLFCWSAVLFAHGMLDSLASLDQIKPGVTRAEEVRKILGAPARTLNFPARGIQALEYDARDGGRRLVVSIAVGNDGIVRDILRLGVSHP
jgi:hypothetical protein